MLSRGIRQAAVRRGAAPDGKPTILLWVIFSVDAIVSSIAGFNAVLGPGLLFAGCYFHYWFGLYLEYLDMTGKLHNGDADDVEGNEGKKGTATWRTVYDYYYHEFNNHCVLLFGIVMADSMNSFAWFNPLPEEVDMAVAAVYVVIELHDLIGNLGNVMGPQVFWFIMVPCLSMTSDNYWTLLLAFIVSQPSWLLAIHSWTSLPARPEHANVYNVARSVALTDIDNHESSHKASSFPAMSMFRISLLFGLNHPWHLLDPDFAENPKGPRCTCCGFWMWWVVWPVHVAKNLSRVCAKGPREIINKNFEPWMQTLAESHIVVFAKELEKKGPHPENFKWACCLEPRLKKFYGWEQLEAKAQAPDAADQSPDATPALANPDPEVADVMDCEPDLTGTDGSSGFIDSWFSNDTSAEPAPPAPADTTIDVDADQNQICVGLCTV